MRLDHLDVQLLMSRSASEVPDLTANVWGRLASAIYDDIAGLGEEATNRLRQSILIPPERYLEELTAFQAWMDLAAANASIPVVVRAQVMTQLYVSFVWLRDSLMTPITKVLTEQTAFAKVEQFLRTGRRRLLRNAVAHGNWCYLPDFTGLECWTEPSRGAPHERFVITDADLAAWQMLSRGTAIAVLVALAGT